MTMFVNETVFIPTATSSPDVQTDAATEAYRRAIHQARDELTETEFKVMGSRRLARWLGIKQRLRNALDAGGIQSDKTD